MTIGMHVRGFGVCAAALTTLCGGQPALAGSGDGDKFDVFIARPTDGGNQTLIGGALLTGDASTNVLDTTSRIFEADLEIAPFDPTGDPAVDDVTLFNYTAEEPGFFNAGDNDPEVGGPGFTNPFDATNPPGTGVLLDGEVVVVEQVSLEYWDGAPGPVNFVPLTDPATQPRLEIEPIDTFGDENGFIDDHPDFNFFEAGNPLGPDGLPAGGIYLATLTATLTGPDGPGGDDDLLPSDPIFVLFVTGEEFEDAVEIAERFLIPEPASIAMLLVGGLAACGRRRVA